jgi:hypothetical protein
MYGPVYQGIKSTNFLLCVCVKVFFRNSAEVVKSRSGNGSTESGLSTAVLKLSRTHLINGVKFTEAFTSIGSTWSFHLSGSDKLI